MNTASVEGRFGKYIISQKFTEISKAGDFMAGHNEWIKRGFEDAVFLLAGSLQPGLGGFVFAQNISMSELKNRVNTDPFVIENIVGAEMIEIDPK